MCISVCVSVCVCVCLSLCLSVCELISQTSCAMFTNFFVHVAYYRGSILLCGVMQSQGEGAILGVFFPIDNVLYSIAFGTHTKTVEPIEIPFGLMTCVGFMYHVLGGGPDPTRLVGNFGRM